MSTIQCIFCLEEKVSSKEHVFPDSLGGLLIIYDVCKDCNDKLGEKVDYHLVDHGLMQLARFTKGLKGKKGTIPNPLSVGKSTDDPDMTLRYKHTSDGTPGALYVIPNVIFDDGKYRVMVDASEPDRLVETVNKILIRNGLESMTKEEIFSKAHYEKTENPRMDIEMVIDMHSYRKAIIKIIYEMTYYWLGKDYLNDEMAIKIREYILSKELEVDGLIEKVELVGDKRDVLTSLADSDSHIAVLIKNRDRISCYINIFNNFHGLVVVTEKATLYKDVSNRFLINDTKEKLIRESSLAEEITRNSRK
ncbi:HNH endonuclease [Exiguobacterium sp. s192]|uniref:HNH endonuclease n=1 Tax=Exiguobacterium sp. s192 TaxID=2751206 RepID=UPI001BE92B3D|nr:HNH endonuclease [Exiguobacterium sp. s192]